MKCNYRKRIANKETKERPTLKDAKPLSEDPAFDLDEEKNTQLQKAKSDYLDKYPQFLPSFLRQIRMIKQLFAKLEQERLRDEKYKEPTEWEQEGYKE